MSDKASDDLVERQQRAVNFAISWGASGTYGRMLAEFAIRETEPLRAQLAAAEASEDKWMEEATYEIGGAPHLWSVRAKAAEAQLASATKALEPILEIIKREWDFKGAHPHRQALIEQAERSLKPDGGGK